MLSASIQILLSLCILIGASLPSHANDAEITRGYFQRTGDHPISIHYYSAGSADKPVILFLHGFPQFAYTWRDYLKTFGHDYQAIAPDLRGFNFSSKPLGRKNYSLDIVVEDIKQLADHFAGIDQPFILVGHDWGGIVAHAFSIKYKHRLSKFVSINAPHPAAFAREIENNWWQRIALSYRIFLSMPISASIIVENLDWFLDWVYLDDKKMRIFSFRDRLEYRRVWSSEYSVKSATNWYRYISPFPVEEDKTIYAPTLYIWGMRDIILHASNLDGIEEFVPEVQVHRIEDATHWVVDEKKEAVMAIIRDFIKPQTSLGAKLMQPQLMQPQLPPAPPHH